METKERDAFLSFLFDRDDCEVVNVKFFRGPARANPEEFCREANRVLRAAMANPVDTVPVSGRARTSRADLLKELANNC